MSIGHRKLAVRVFLRAFSPDRNSTGGSIRAAIVAQFHTATDSERRALSVG